MERKLATIERRGEIRPIEGADAIEVAAIRGWQVVIKKGDFKEGDLCVYCEIDSLMPDRPEFEFLKHNKHRIRTVKLRGHVSQGIAFPLEVLTNVGYKFGLMSVIPDEDPIPCIVPEDSGLLVNDPREIRLEVGTDVTDMLGVTKYEAPIPPQLEGKVIGGFPSHSPKTDEERIQNLSEKFESGELHKTLWTTTEKLDGTSATYYVSNDRFGIASRNLELDPKDTKNTFYKVAKELDLEDAMRTFMNEHGYEALTIQGELIGEGIQKNRYQVRGHTVRFFRAFDPVAYTFLDLDGLCMMLEFMGLDDNCVPVLDRNYRLPDTLGELIAHADGQSVLASTRREGEVFVANALDRHAQGRQSFKVISNKFELGNEK